MVSFWTVVIIVDILMTGDRFYHVGNARTAFTQLPLDFIFVIAIFQICKCLCQNFDLRCGNLILTAHPIRANKHTK
jgi:low temperature requirement protein LtrA